MLKGFFKKTLGRDDMLGLLAAALKKHDQSTVIDCLTHIAKEYETDPEVCQPVEVALNQLHTWNDPYLVLMTTARILEHAPESRQLALIADKAALKAAALLESSDPCYALEIYARMFERMPPESGLQLDCIDGALRVTNNPGPVDFESLARRLAQMVDASDDSDPAQTKLQNRLFDMADKTKDPVLAMELFLEIFGNSDTGSAIERDSYDEIIKISKAVSLENTSLILEGLYHAHEVAAENPARQRAIEDEILRHADTLLQHDSFSSFSAYHFLLEGLPEADERTSVMIDRLLPMCEEGRQRDFESSMQALALIINKADPHSFAQSRARTLYNQAVQRSTPQDYAEIKPLSPKNFILLQGNQPR
ncbi:MAG: hypothetical protein ACK4NR_05215 [Micavibrio sp.]